jgi:ArsR family transcriptional regulator
MTTVAPRTSRGLTRTARLFHALADPTRLAIVQRLRDGEHCVCDLTDLLGAAQSRLSFHLKVLRDAGIIEGRKEGRWSYYSLRPEAWEQLESTLGELKPTPGRTRARCCT